ncbi:uridine diphosphate-N-acetylglucosamine-binding protein YvcK [Colwellia sp. MB02u-18]|uniref:gluconeogenesis factor YvcK family protein n=1 Tax=unclassified Colwellia TaxID=196834 RepID=UPI0015F65B26|nr:MULTISPECIES: uridine diphosphate-N-acetylglucosamine-binding protein YvcK [unclassified Colwellia]MBA6224099.1 uridine diphosphate-N-acetylglucosamine-binding protein YvcK [Colwellia sp. MB3u-45]MBA6269009.1 uridine diphosphate-N-acetylglucosamine-binding protein YvcK [Colwellia sp. MB3u-43]MBA6320905.1 uridine diphosphate-N-acetylglucosamine-binding protein YvcK [Colwellia sp. MB02u-19]MBA6324185.1 uridine diphosphate-N-acetylglucosamine-binding protein YvcK [Colwellia sp. MB02u-18]MBA633
MQLKELNVVAIGGGHGLGRVLSTLSFLGNQLTGIVTTTDNGGSTGRLRKRSSSIAWGDLRNCLTQLVDEKSVGSQLFDFRFNGNDELGGHNLGNLILYGLGEIHSRPLDSIKLVRRLLRVKTPVLPMSETPTDLMAFYSKGRCRIGEVSVDNMSEMPKSLMLAPLVKTLPSCVEAILNADLVILGPGSFLTSVIPPLLVRDISNALNQTNAHRVFIDNIVAENSPAAALSLDEKLAWIEENVGCLPIDSAICHDASITSTRIDVYHHELSSDTVSHFHSRDKLISALNFCISKASNRAETMQKSLVNAS